MPVSRPQLGLLFAIVLAIASVLELSASQRTIGGWATVTDGDTFRIGDERIRLAGIDAPESHQTCTDSNGGPYRCGRASTEALAMRLARGPVECSVAEKDTHGRDVAICEDATGTDLNRWLVRNGHATNYIRYSGGRYQEDELAARHEGLGIWAGDFQGPREYRQARTSERTTVSSIAPTGCPIKGNVSSGERIYHLPGSRSYEATGINLARGERWFCSEAAARAAGWRAARPR